MTILLKWLDTKKGNISENHTLDTWRSLNNHIFPHLGKLPIRKITAIKVIDTIKPIAAKGNLETVKRLCQRLNEVMVYAVNTGLLSANPVTGISKAFQTPVKRHLPTLLPEQLPELMEALSVASIMVTTRCVIEWQLHTVVRPSEAAGARWDEIDIENALWHIPAERMKKKKPHSVPLSAQSLSILEVMRSISSKYSDFVFPSDRSLRKTINAQTAIKRMDFEKQLVAHGIRVLASTTLNEQGFDGDIIEAALAHTDDNEVRNAYNRSDYMKRRKPTMTWWSKHIEKAASGNLSITGNKTLKIIGG
ncbi:MAG: integrase [Candidatus Endobugula sp.]|jgi:integrase